MRKVLLSRISFSALMLTFLTFIFLFFNFTSAGNWDKPLSGGGSFVYVNETQTNSSVYWGDLLSVHSTQFNKLAGILSLNTNWLENFIINVDKWDNYYTKTQSNNRYLQSESDPNYFNNPNQYYNSTTIPQSYNLAAYYNRTEIDNILLNYYNDSEVDVLINDLNISFGNYYNKTEVDSLINGIPTPDLTIFYNKTEVDNLLNDYYPLSNPYGYLNESYDDSWINNTFYNQTQVDNLINGIDLSIYYTKTESDNTFVKLSNLVSLVGNWTLDKIGYYTKVEIDNKGYLQSESDPTYYSNPNAYYNSTTLPNIDLSPYWKRDGTLTATGNWDLGTYNITADYFIGNGSQLTGIPSPDLSGLVPYTGATQDVDLGANDLTADSLITNKHIYLPDTDDLSGVYGIIYKANVPFIHNYHKIYATDGITPLEGQNLFIGEDAGNFIMGNTATAAEQSSNNLGIGKEALKSLTTGYNNIGIGALSASKIKSGRGNIYIGGNAGASSTSLSFNVGIGQDSVKSATSSGGNLVGVGYETLMSVRGGGSLTALGTSAGRTITTNSHGSFIGYRAGYYARGGASTFIGSEAGHGGSSTSSDGNFNTALGYQALRSFTSGQRNTAIGQTAGYSISSGQRNTIVGSEAMYGLKTGSYNTAIGEGAGRYYSTGTSAHTSGTYSVFLGRLTRPLGNAQTNQIVIGDSAVGKGSNTVTLGNDAITNTYLKGNVIMQDDNDKLYLGTGNDASIYYDGTNLVFNTSESGSGIAYFSNNVSATGYITRTSIFDKSKGTALSYIKDASEYLDVKGDINHKSFYGYVEQKVTDFSRPVIDYLPKEVCSTDENEKEKCVIEYEIKTTYPYTKIEDGVDLGKEIDVLRQAVYELKQQNEFLQEQINNLTEKDTKIEEANTRQDSALCSIKLFDWCLIK